MRLVLMTSRGWVRKEAMPPASPVERRREEMVWSTLPMLFIDYTIFKPFVLRNNIRQKYIRNSNMCEQGA